jgi:uncharacterized protein YjbI with pentapeptide repeats
MKLDPSRRLRTFVPIRESALEAHRWWVLGGRVGTGQLAFSQVDLRCVWLAMAELTDMVLHDAAIGSACFEASTLDAADLLECNGSHVDFRSASLRRAILQDCELLDGRFDHADLSGARVVDCAMQGCTFAGASWAGALVKRTDLRRAHFDNTDLRGTVFVGCDLRGARFTGGIHTSLRLVRCDLTGAWLDHELDGVDMVDCVNAPVALSRRAG